MSGVHDSIAFQALAALQDEERSIFMPYLEDIKKSSWYPDIFADRSMSSEAKAAVDPEADRYIYPEPPESDDYRKIERLTEEEEKRGVAPLRAVYLIEYYMKNAVHCLRAGDARAAAKFCAVYSHVIADMAEPIHAVNPSIVDLVVPPPPELVGLELHANVEGLCAKVDITGYRPRTLGSSVPRAVMVAYAGLDEARRTGAAQTVKIVQALYAGDRDRATAFSQKAQNESARKTTDFMHTVVQLAQAEDSNGTDALDLCSYPYARADVDMLYRYRPLVDVSIVPFSGGKALPLCLTEKDGAGTEHVHGLSVVPFLGPPFSPDCHRSAEVEYYLVPSAYKRFRARVGANPLLDKGKLKIRFTVTGDEKELFQSSVMSLNHPPAEIDVNIENHHWLRLSTLYATNPTPEDAQGAKCSWALHGVWAEPRLE